MTSSRQRKKRRQQEGALQRVVDASERLGLYQREDEELREAEKRKHGRMTRVMMQLLGDCELPAYVTGAAYFRFGYCTADVPEHLVEELRRHPGVIALNLLMSRTKVQSVRPPDAQTTLDFGPPGPRRGTG